MTNQFDYDKLLGMDVLPADSCRRCGRVFSNEEVIKFGMRKHPLCPKCQHEKQWKYSVVEDNGGGLSLFVFRGRKVIFAHSGYEYSNGSLITDLDELDKGTNIDLWEGCEENPQEDWDVTQSSEYGWKIVADGGGGTRHLHKAIMGRAAQLEFNVTDEDRDRAWSASQLGSSRSEKKAASSRANGKNGGRPKKI